ncbi:MAG: shikimate dehydrogenase, partial [Burkholderiaceae bacterium]
MITGNTRLFGIVADPIDQVQTPQMLNRIFEQQGRDAVLVPFHVSAAGLPEVFAAFRQVRNLGGYIVTVPHKVAALDLCDEIGDAARAIGAVNTIRRDPDGRLIGDMFDGTGFVAGLKKCGNDP